MDSSTSQPLQQHPEFIEFIDQYSAEVSIRQWSWLGVMLSFGLNIILAKLFAKPRPGEDIFTRHHVHPEYLKARLEQYGIDPGEEQPLLLSSFFVLTNRYFYFDAQKSRSMTNTEMVRGRVDLRDIESIATERGRLTNNIIAIAINNQNLCAIPFNGPSDAKVLETLLARMNGRMSELLAEPA